LDDTLNSDGKFFKASRFNWLAGWLAGSWFWRKLICFRSKLALSFSLSLSQLYGPI